MNVLVGAHALLIVHSCLVEFYYKHNNWGIRLIILMYSSKVWQEESLAGGKFGE